MLFQIKSYVDFLFKSSSQHGIHSPFVFDLVTKCFCDKTKFQEYKILKKYRNSLLADENSIEVVDFGAGSKVFKSNTRQISQIAKTAGISAERAELLFRVAKYFKPRKILEIGTSLGLATSALSLGKPSASIVTLEGCPQTADVAKDLFEKFGLINAKSVVAEFKAYLKSMSREPTSIDLIYFDGNHQKQATLDYFEMLLDSATNDSVWIFDDIHWSPEMEQSWEIIKKNPKVTVTIDTFQWGFVFFRKEQKKEHFVIRA